MTKQLFEGTESDSRDDDAHTNRDLAAEGQRARHIAALEKLHRSYIRTQRDNQLAKEFSRLLEGTSLSLNGRRPEGRALIVIGESGAGKTHSLRRLIEGRRELLPQNMAIGPTMPIVSITAPSPCTLRQLAIELLRALGYPLDRDVRENVAWNRVREQLRLRKVLVVHIDEMQHAVRFPDSTETQKVSDTLKNVMQQAEWPVSLILSGLPSLVQFVQRDIQLGRRCRLLGFEPLRFPKDVKGLHHIVNDVVKKADLKPVGIESEEFLARLCRAAEGQFGRVVQISRTAAEDAIRAGSRELTITDFASAYAATTGCSSDANLFLARDWEFIRPGVVPAEAPTDEASAPQASKKGKSR